MKQLVKLWERPSYDGKKFTYYLLYTDEQGRRRQKFLGHADRRKAERQQAQFERKLTMGIVNAAQQLTERSNGQRRPKWDLLIIVALSTGLRRGELLNCTWVDIDFAEQTIKVSPKTNTAATWEWGIKDTDSRTLPLSDMLTQLLVDHQSRQPEGQPYVFVPPARYDYIQQELRAKDKWTYSDSRTKVITNFTWYFNKILRKARVEEGQFHDLRRTAICNWFREGLKELDVMRLAGHADFKTTHRYYLRVRDDLVDRAREATARGLCQNLLQNCCSSDFRSPEKKGWRT
jgi:integrase